VATSLDTGAYPPVVLAEFEVLAEECRLCYQCGQCTSSCPSGRELYRGPRRLVRLILAGEIEAVMKSDDLWRCTECGSCTQNCRMDIDITSILQRIRQLERDHGTAIRCPERSAAELATNQLRNRTTIDNLQFGAAMMARGHVPRDKVGAAGMGVKIAKGLLSRRKSGPGGAAAVVDEPALTLPFYAGCALPQDYELHGLVHEVAAGFGIRLDETEAGCCGHPSRGAVAGKIKAGQTVQTACPACDASLCGAGVEAVPLWDTLTEQARRQGLRMTAAAPAFVPYVGCLADRDAALAALAAAAEQAGATVELAYPSLHNGCCGALGGMYRGASKASAMLLEFAAERRAPVVTPCTLCRDNLRSAARELKLAVPVHFWPEFFRAAGPEGQNDD
jgi:heterodisulfide reductase subunit C